MEEKIVIATLIKNYKVTAISDVKRMTPVPDVVTRPPSQMLVRLEKRVQWLWSIDFLLEIIDYWSIVVIFCQLKIFCVEKLIFIDVCNW